jgi:predicted AlkP superfamily pyrophosphatase or phosphodiesterase
MKSLFLFVCLFFFVLSVKQKPKRHTLYGIIDGQSEKHFMKRRKNLERISDMYGYPAGYDWMLKYGKHYTDMEVPQQHSSTDPHHTTQATGATVSEHGIVSKTWKECDETGCYSRHAFNHGDYIEINGAPMNLGMEKKAKNSPENIHGTTFIDEYLEFNPEAVVRCFSRKGEGGAIPMCGRKKTYADGSKSDNMAFWYDAGGPRDDWALPGGKGTLVSTTYYGDAYPPEIQALKDLIAIEDEFNPIFGDHIEWDLIWDREFYVENDKSRVDITEKDYESADPLVGFPKYQQFEGRSGNDYGAIAKGPEGDSLIFMAAIASIRSGRVPDILVVGLSVTDAVGHLYGPSTLETEDIFYRGSIGFEEILLAYEAEGIPRTEIDIILTSDHGMGEPVVVWSNTFGYTNAVPTNFLGEYEADQTDGDAIEAASWIGKANKYLAKEYDLYDDETGEIIKIIPYSVRDTPNPRDPTMYIATDYVSPGSVSIDKSIELFKLYDDEGEFVRIDHKLVTEVIEELKNFFYQFDGIYRITSLKDIRSGGVLNDEMAESYYEGRSPDLLISADQHTFRYDGVHTLGGYDTAHGSRYTYDSNIIALIASKEITPGEVHRKATSMELSATVCMLLGVSTQSANKAPAMTECIDKNMRYY